jgi:GNAT superfamily N-acetyltransferase
MSDIVVRSANPADVATLSKLTAELGYSDSQEDLHRRLETISSLPEHKVVVAEHNGKVVGFMSFHSLDLLTGAVKLGRITALVVTESERGKGIGTLLIAKGEEFAREAGCKLIELTSNRRRVEAHMFYESLGYEGSSKRFVKKI